MKPGLAAVARPEDVGAGGLHGTQRGEARYDLCSAGKPAESAAVSAGPDVPEGHDQPWRVDLAAEPALGVAAVADQGADDVDPVPFHREHPGGERAGRDRAAGAVGRRAVPFDLDPTLLDTVSVVEVAGIRHQAHERGVRVHEEVAVARVVVPESVVPRQLGVGDRALKRRRVHRGGHERADRVVEAQRADDLHGPVAA